MELVARVFGEDVALVLEAGVDAREAAEGALLLPVEGVSLGVVEPQVEAQRQLVVAEDAAEGTLEVRLARCHFSLGIVFDAVAKVRDALQHGGQFDVLKEKRKSSVFIPNSRL